MSSLLYVCFLENDLELMEHHWLNRMAARLAPKSKSGEMPKIHVELFFPTKGAQNKGDIVTGQACSIYYNSKVFLTRKNFSRKQWSFRTLNVNNDQLERIFNFCKAHRGEKFNHLSYYTYPLNCYDKLKAGPYWGERFGMKPQWFCSEICVAALQAGGVLDHSLHPSMHPQALFALLEESTTPDCVRDYTDMKLSFA